MSCASCAVCCQPPLYQDIFFSLLSSNHDALTIMQAAQQSTISVPVLNLPLRPSTLSHLIRCGFSSTGDVERALTMSSAADGSEQTDAGNEQKGRASYEHLAQELSCSPSKAAEYVQELDEALNSVGLSKASASSVSNLPTAASLLTNTTRQIVSFCLPLDKLLGGGVSLAEVTEIAGLPGSGKTQLAMQLAVDARIPSKQGGVEGCTAVIDGEGSWTGERLWSMAEALVEHVEGSARRRMEAKRFRDAASSNGCTTSAATVNGGEELIPEWFTPQSIMEGIHIFRVHDETSQTATLYSLPKFLSEQEARGHPIRLLIIDSIAFHYRAASAKNKNMNNTYNLSRMAGFLSELASEFELAVVAINHMTTRVDRNGSKLIPALGESWAHSVTSRLIVDYFRGNLSGDMSELRTAKLVKSPHKPCGTAMFMITEKGIRGPPNRLAEMVKEQQQQTQKRARLDD